MRFHAPLDEVLRGRSALAVLRVLVRFPEKEFSGRELAGLAEIAPSKAIQELERLLGNGVVTRRTVGRTHLWKANVEHEILALLSPPLKRERSAFARLETLLADAFDRPFVREAYIFGSVARAEERPDSDVDVLVIVASEADKKGIEPHVAAVANTMLSRFGNRLNTIVYSADEARRKKDLPLLASARAGIPLVEAAPR